MSNNKEKILTRNNVLEFRLRSGYKRKDLAKLTGFSYSLIGKIERGEQEKLNVTQMRKIADVLNVSVDDLTKPTNETAKIDKFGKCTYPEIDFLTKVRRFPISLQAEILKMVSQEIAKLYKFYKLNPKE